MWCTDLENGQIILKNFFPRLYLEKTIKVVLQWITNRIIEELKWIKLKQRLVLARAYTTSPIPAEVSR